MYGLFSFRFYVMFWVVLGKEKKDIKGIVRGEELGGRLDTGQGGNVTFFVL